MPYPVPGDAVQATSAEPWNFGGTLFVSVFRVPAAAVPRKLLDATPERRYLLTVGRHTFVILAMVRFGAGQTPPDNELAVALPTHGSGRWQFTVPQLWVDDSDARDGIRTKWGIPADFATFDGDESSAGGTVHLETEDGPLVELRARYGRLRIPGRVRFPADTVQRVHGRRVLSYNRIAARLRGLSADWHFETTSPLGYLAGRKPLFSFALTNATVIFGARFERD